VRGIDGGRGEISVSDCRYFYFIFFLPCTNLSFQVFAFCTIFFFFFLILLPPAFLMVGPYKVILVYYSSIRWVLVFHICYEYDIGSIIIRGHLTRSSSNFACLRNLTFVLLFTEKDLCKPNPCQYGDKCHQTGSETYPGVKTVCDPNPCRHGGKCIEVDDEDFQCACQNSFGGKTCNGKLTLYVNAAAGKKLMKEVKVYYIGKLYPFSLQF